MAANTVRDLLLDADGDFAIQSGDLVLVAGAAAIVQAVRIRLQFFKGEWYLDLAAGLPYYQSIFVKNPNVGVLQGIFRDEILNTPGVSSVESLTLNLDRQTRKLTVQYTASTDVGLIGSTEVL